MAVDIRPGLSRRWASHDKPRGQRAQSTTACGRQPAFARGSLRPLGGQRRVQYLTTGTYNHAWPSPAIRWDDPSDPHRLARAIARSSLARDADAQLTRRLAASALKRAISDTTSWKRDVEFGRTTTVKDLRSQAAPATSGRVLAPRLGRPRVRLSTVADLRLVRQPPAP